MLAFALAAEGETERARDLLALAEPGAAADGTFTYWIAKVHALLGDQDAALDWLGRAAQLGYWDSPWMRKDPVMESLRGHAGFLDHVAGLDVRRAGLESALSQASASLSTVLDS